MKDVILSALSAVFLIPLLIIGVALLFLLILPFVALGIIVTIIVAPFILLAKIFD